MVLGLLIFGELAINVTKTPEPIFSKLLRKILRRFLVLGQVLTVSGKTLNRHKFTLLTNKDLTTTSLNNVQHDDYALLFPNSS